MGDNKGVLPLGSLLLLSRGPALLLLSGGLALLPWGDLTLLTGSQMIVPGLEGDELYRDRRHCGWRRTRCCGWLL